MDPVDPVDPVEEGRKSAGVSWRQLIGCSTPEGGEQELWVELKVLNIK